MKLNPLLMVDFYKTVHKDQYPKGTTLVYSNFTPRKSRVKGINHMVFFGFQYLVKEYLITQFNEQFFHRDKDEVVAEYKKVMDCALGKDVIDVTHIGDLHDLQYLPIRIKAVKEGTSVPIGTPVLTMYNTHPDFFWLTNYLETLISCLLWKPCTSATTAKAFREAFDDFSERTGSSQDFVPFKGHDFSLRGLSGIEDACCSGAGHLLSFVGTDSIPTIPWLEEYYGADQEKEFIGGSVCATEHSVQSAGTREGEFNTYKRLITEIYPHGIISIVSDTYDFWKVVTEFLPKLKKDILNRANNTDQPVNKVVIRPDSGIPHKIICGDPEGETEPERLGLIECLWDVFGGTVNEKGFRDLHPCIGAIYGEAITLDEQQLILQGLADNGFSSGNIVMGIGSYMYQYVTRDSLGIAIKATYVEVNGQGRNIFKDPKTGAWKKSHKGLLRVNEDLSCTQQVSWEEEDEGLLEDVFVNGKLVREQTLSEIREIVSQSSLVGV